MKRTYRQDGLTLTEALEVAQIFADFTGEPQHIGQDRLNKCYKVVPYGSRPPGGYGRSIHPSRRS